MATNAAPVPVEAMTAASRQRWREFLADLAGLIPAGPVAVLIDGPGPQPELIAGQLAATLTARGRPCQRLTSTAHNGTGITPSGTGTGTTRHDDTVLLAAGPAWRDARDWDVVIWLRGRPADPSTDAGIVVDLHDPAWPVIRHVAAPPAGHGPWYIAETRAFFSVRAATWDTKFGDDGPAYAAAVAEAGIREGGTAIDVGCGTGRALPALRQAVGADGAVIAVDLTPEMLRCAQSRGRVARAALVLADASRLPVGTGSADAIFAAGLITHLPDAEAGLRELARVTRPGGLLIVFHPTGRAALAARHGRTLGPDEPLGEHRLRRSTDTTGWRLTTYDDAESRFLAIATRR
jgi:SAM-dependent methyltransferase